MKIQPYMLAAALAAALVAGSVHAGRQDAWSNPQPVDAINTAAAAEGCPIESPNGLELYFASNRNAAGAQGKLDIWRAPRRSIRTGWLPAENAGAPVSSPEFDYCPTPLPGHWLMFVSSAARADDCFPGDAPPAAPTGGPAAGDIYLTREHPRSGWTPPLNLGCYPNGPNTDQAEFSPSLVDTPSGQFLFFSSNGYPDSQGQDIYMSRVLDDGTVLPGQRVAELSTPADDRMPNVRRGGLEIVFSSNRAGAVPFDQDIYIARRRSPTANWDAPERIDNPEINTPGSETRASFSGDGRRLYFGRKTSPSDPGDVYVSMRARRFDR